MRLCHNVHATTMKATLCRRWSGKENLKGGARGGESPRNLRMWTRPQQHVKDRKIIALDRAILFTLFTFLLPITIDTIIIVTLVILARFSTCH